MRVESRESSKEFASRAVVPPPIGGRMGGGHRKALLPANGCAEKVHPSPPQEVGNEETSAFLAFKREHYGWRHFCQTMLCMLMILMLSSTSVFATVIDQPLADAAQEQTARTLFHELRCVVCEGQSIAESNATLAAQMRDQVRARVAKGETNAEILARFHAAYGDSILMTPPVKESTLLLWLAPLVLLGAGALLLWRSTRPTKGPTP